MKSCLRSSSLTPKRLFNSLALTLVVGFAATPLACQESKWIAGRSASMAAIDSTNYQAATALYEIAHSGLPHRGATDAKVSIIFFDDYECPYSSVMYQRLFTDVMKSYGDRVSAFIRPIANSGIHPWAKRAAINASCLATSDKDSFWEFTDHVHANQSEFGFEPESRLNKLALDIARRRGIPLSPIQECIDAQSDAVVKESYRYVKILEVRAVPTLFVNGEKIQSAVSAERVTQSIERALLAPNSFFSKSSPSDAGVSRVLLAK